MKKLFSALLACLSFNAAAADAVTVDIPDASELLWQKQLDGQPWFRNLNEFNSNMLSCCYNYGMDVKPPQGRIFYAMLLSKNRRA